MQQRHIDRQIYFDESAKTSRDFYLAHIQKFKNVDSTLKILEIGCGEGGNLLPFAEIGCRVTGIDCSDIKITNAKSFFDGIKLDGKFTTINFFDMDLCDFDKYDIILIHDVIEHITDKVLFMEHLKLFIAKDGIVFFGFPAWQMPFGGHQQVCQSRVCSKLPFIHLLPECVYGRVLKLFGENKYCIDELIDIKRCKVSIESFENLVKCSDFRVIDRFLWFINPHYQQKFNLKPRKLYAFISKIRYVRNIFTTSCFYVVTPND